MRDTIAAALLFIGGSALVISGTTQGMTGPVPDPGFVSGTIRWVDANTWTVLDDATHTPTGIQSVQLSRPYVRVDYTFTATEVGSCQVTPDEAFTAAGVRVGTSVGLDGMNIYFFMGDSATPVNPSLLSRANANVWITCHHNSEVPVG